MNKKKINTLLKVSGSLLLLFFVYSTLNLTEIKGLILQVQFNWLLTAALFYLASQYVASLRLNGLFSSLGLTITNSSHFKLYLLGMFYNLFLPFGIGGDAYKAFLIKKQLGKKINPLIKLLFLDRLGGLLAILLLLGALVFFVTSESALFNNYKWGLIPLGFLGFGVQLYFFPELRNFLPKVLLLSIISQAMQVICCFFLLKSLGIQENYLTYGFVFLISSIATIIPITIGGLGIREYVFLQSAVWLHFSPAVGVALAALFFVLTVTSSLSGAYWVWKGLDLK